VLREKKTSTQPRFSPLERRGWRSFADSLRRSNIINMQRTRMGLTGGVPRSTQKTLTYNFFFSSLDDTNTQAGSQLKQHRMPSNYSTGNIKREDATEEALGKRKTWVEAAMVREGSRQYLWPCVSHRKTVVDEFDLIELVI
jgi:hypothetical protein